MRDVSIWRGLLGVENTIIERIVSDEDDQVLVAHVRPVSRQRGRCGACGRRSLRYDGGADRRRWRTLNLGTVHAMLEAHSLRVRCREQRVILGALSLARHDARHTYAFDETVAWLATQSATSTVTELMRIASRTVRSIITKLWADVEATHRSMTRLFSAVRKSAARSSLVFRALARSTDARAR